MRGGPTVRRQMGIKVRRGEEVCTGSPGHGGQTQMGEEDRVYGRVTGVWQRRGVWWGSVSTQWGHSVDGGDTVSCCRGGTAGGTLGALLWVHCSGCTGLGVVLEPSGSPSGPPVPLPFTATGGPRRSPPSLSYLLCWARLLSLLLNFLALSVNCSKVNLKNKDRT